MTDPTPDLILPKVDPNRFTGVEMMELQTTFDCEFADMADYVLGKASGRLRRQTDIKMRDGSNKIRFADEMLRHMIWLVQRRTDPGAKLEALLPLSWTQLLAALRDDDDTPKAGRKGTRSLTT